MNHERLIRFVTRQLDASVNAMSRDQRERLRAARENALAHYVPRQESRLAGIAGVFHVGLTTRHALARFAVMVLLALGVAYWHATQYIGDLAEVDSAILTDEMPMDVITDKGFNAWLISSGAR